MERRNKIEIIAVIIIIVIVSLLVSFIRRWAEGEGKTLKHKLIALNIVIGLFALIMGIIAYIYNSFIFFKN